MKLAITAKSEGLEAQIDDRFGRAEYFVIVDTETNDAISIENTAKNESHGAGGNAVRLLYNNGVDAVITPELGPKAAESIKAFEIKVYKKSNYNIVKEAIDAFNNNKLEEMTQATVNEHNGLRKA